MNGIHTSERNTSIVGNKDSTLEQFAVTKMSYDSTLPSVDDVNSFLRPSVYPQFVPSSICLSPTRSSVHPSIPTCSSVHPSIFNSFLRPSVYPRLVPPSICLSPTRFSVHPSIPNLSLRPSCAFSSKLFCGRMDEPKRLETD